MDSKTIRPIIVGAALFLGGCSFALDTLWPSLTGEEPAGRDQPAQQAQAPAQAPSVPAPAPPPATAPTPAPAPQAAAQTPPQPETTNSEAPGAAPGTSSAAADGQKAAGRSTTGRKPLLVIRFDRENVAYEQALYNAVSRVLERRPNATFELVAVVPASGGEARQALNSNQVSSSAENVLWSLQRMGFPIQRIEISAQASAQAAINEIHLYLN